MKERITSLIATGSGVATFSISIETIIQKTTPVIAWIGLIMGTLLSLVMFCYWTKKLFKNEKNK